MLFVYIEFYNYIEYRIEGHKSIFELDLRLQALKIEWVCKKKSTIHINEETQFLNPNCNGQK